MPAGTQQAMQQIIDLAEKVSAPLGLSVLDARISQQGKLRTLEVTIFRKGGRIGLSDCEQVSRELEELLDNLPEPPVAGTYALEVQSPGIDRKLTSEREFACFAGQAVEVKTKENIENLGSLFAGTLLCKKDNVVVIGRPCKISEKPQKRPGHKQGATGKEAVPGGLEVAQAEIEMSKIIHIRLLPED